MPRGDGTGPMGAGSMTGRGMGFCGSFAAQGFTNGLCGRGMGLGRRIRGGFIEGKDFLEAQAKHLSEALEIVKKRIDTL